MDGYELRSILFFFVILKALEGSNGPYVWGFEAQVSFHNLRLGLKNATLEWNAHVFKRSQHGHDDQPRKSQHKPTISQAGSRPINSLEKVCKYKPIFYEFVNEYPFTACRAGCSTHDPEDRTLWMDDAILSLIQTRLCHTRCTASSASELTWFCREFPSHHVLTHTERDSFVANGVILLYIPYISMVISMCHNSNQRDRQTDRYIYIYI